MIHNGAEVSFQGSFSDQCYVFIYFLMDMDVNISLPEWTKPLNFGWKFREQDCVACFFF